MPSFGPVLSALYSRLNGDATLQSLLGGSGRVYDSLAPEGAARPFVIVSLTSDTVEHNLATRQRDDYLLLVKAITDGGSVAVADQIVDRVSVLLQDYALTVSGRTHMSLRRDGDVRYVETVDGQRYNHSGAQWRCMVGSG